MDNLTELETQYVYGKEDERARILRIIERDIAEAADRGNYLYGVWLNKLKPIILEGDTRD